MSGLRGAELPCHARQPMQVTTWLANPSRQLRRGRVVAVARCMLPPADPHQVGFRSLSRVMHRRLEGRFSQVVAARNTPALAGTTALLGPERHDVREHPRAGGDDFVAAEVAFV